MDDELYRGGVNDIIRETIDISYTDEEVELYLYLTSTGTNSNQAKEMVMAVRANKGII